MRAADVPARIVVGYQGGEWVPPTALGSGYLDVRQSDAHAWSEVWIEGLGWVRVDPTIWVNPERLTDRRSVAVKGYFPWGTLLKREWNRLDLVWNRWVLGFDREEQLRLLGEWRSWQGLVLLAGLSTALIPLVWLLQRTSSPYGARQRQGLEPILRALQSKGITPERGENLQQFCLRASESLPHLRELLLTWQSSYECWRFSPAERRTTCHQHLRIMNRKLETMIQRSHYPKPHAKALLIRQSLDDPHDDR